MSNTEPIEPFPEGVKFVGPSVDARGIMQKYELHVGKAESLASMLEEYVFFTPAPLYLFGKLIDAPLIDFVYEEREDIRFYYKKFSKPIFSGLDTPDGNKDWNFVLWALRCDYWEAFVDFMCGLTLTDTPNQSLLQFGLQVFEILDPLVIDKAILIKNNLPLIKIGAFGVNGNQYRVAFEIVNNTTPAELKFYYPENEMVVFANALFSGKNPIEAREAYNRIKEV